MSKKNIEVIVNSGCFQSGSRGVKEYFLWLCGGEVLENENYSIKFKRFEKSRFRQVFSGFWRSEIIWSPSHATSIISRNHVVTVHDLINLDNSKSEKKFFKFFVLYFNLFLVLWVSPAIVCISKATQNRVHAYYPFTKKKTLVFTSPEKIEVGQEVEGLSQVEKGRFILMVTNSLPHKNHDFVLNSLPKYLTNIDLQLVVVGIDPEQVQLKNDKVLFFHKLSDPIMNFLFRECLCICSPSFIEGHNIVLAKGNFLNKPLLASDIQIHREFYPNSVFFSPYKSEELINGLKSICFSPGYKVDSCDLRFKNIQNLKAEYFNLFEKLSTQLNKDD